ncbi:unnamed protein product [Musa acuminata subsp. malaccensis]|uniref:(wild Malaysian banana) hypothetical protein n=1 Tax=Musa acuminata subsp. malaccensis TaxID=214687 RepID=A0A804I2G4_MUSAM|nr:PREDICTED: uncharacterized protein LOC103975774 [Musa acuminata subsp. malaccensis]CAG1861966.1 unnamed protein product [Musa acuminata subsp. malaccensis]
MQHSSMKSHEAGDADHGFRIITLAGDNKGATMKANMDQLMDTDGMMYDDNDIICTYTNNNYQAVNNSFLLRGSCTAEDPGIHVVISEYVEKVGDGDDQERYEKKKENNKKDKKREEDKSKGSTKEGLEW